MVEEVCLPLVIQSASGLLHLFIQHGLEDLRPSVDPGNFEWQLTFVGNRVEGQLQCRKVMSQDSLSALYEHTEGRKDCFHGETWRILAAI